MSNELESQSNQQTSIIGDPDFSKASRIVAGIGLSVKPEVYTSTKTIFNCHSLKIGSPGNIGDVLIKIDGKGNTGFASIFEILDKVDEDIRKDNEFLEAIHSELTMKYKEYLVARKIVRGNNG